MMRMKAAMLVASYGALHQQVWHLLLTIGSIQCFVFIVVVIIIIISTTFVKEFLLRLQLHFSLNKIGIVHFNKLLYHFCGIRN